MSSAIEHKGQDYPGEHEAIISRDLWDKAHAIFAVNRRERAEIQKPTEPDLLKGVLFCGHCGSAMTRSYTKKRKGRMYRYYVCVTAIKQGYAACPVGSLATGEIEAQVTARVRHHLANPAVVGRAAEKAREEAADLDPATVAAQAVALEAAWDHLFPVEQARLVRLLVQTVHVHQDGLRIAYRESGFVALASELAVGGEPLPRPARGGGGFAEASPLEREGWSEFVPLRITRRAGRKVIIAAPDAGETPTEAGRCSGKAEVNPLVKAIARGFRYRGMMDSGEYPTQAALAAKLGVSRTYMNRLIRLTLLAPDIIESIVEGREPAGLSVDALTHGEYPDDWAGQREALGFPADG